MLMDLGIDEFLVVCEFRWFGIELVVWCLLVFWWFEV